MHPNNSNQKLYSTDASDGVSSATTAMYGGGGGGTALNHKQMYGNCRPPPTKVAKLSKDVESERLPLAATTTKIKLCDIDPEAGKLVC